MKSVYVIFVSLFVWTLGVSAEPFTLRDSSTGVTYQCGRGTPNNPVDPACVDGVQNFCRRQTSRGADECFDSSTQACSRGATPTCISGVHESCRRNTSHGSNECYDRAVDSCSGNSLAIQSLIESARQRAMHERSLQ